MTDAEQEFLDQYSEAKKLFQEYTELNDQRKTILKGSSINLPPDAFKLMLENNNEDIESVRSAFLGNSSEKGWSAIFNFIPDRTKVNSDLLFAYSKTKGICNSGQIKEKSIKVGGDFLFGRAAFGVDGNFSSGFSGKSRSDRRRNRTSSRRRSFACAAFPDANFDVLPV